MAGEREGDNSGQRDATADAATSTHDQRPAPASVPGKQSLIQQAYGSGGAPTHHAGHGHAAHPHGSKPAADTINSDDGQNATRADLLRVDPPSIHFGRVPFRSGRDQTEAAPYLATVHNPNADAITIDDIRADAHADFPVFSGDAADTAIPPGGSLSFRVGFRPHRPGEQSTTIHVIALGVSQARLTAEANALDEGGAWEDLRLSTRDVRFPDVTIGQESAPRTIQVTNRSGVPVRIEDVAPTTGDGDQFRVSQASAEEIPAGASTTLTITFNPTHAGAHHATFHVRTPGAHDKDAQHASIDVRGRGRVARATDGPDALSASIDAGGVVGPMLTYQNMLDALHAAQRFTEAGSADDPDHPGHVRADYDRAEKLVSPVLARLDQLERQVPALASSMGFSSTNAWQVFGAAHDPVRIWAGQLRGEGRIPADYYVKSFEVAKEILQALTGEQKDAPTLRALGNAAKWTPLEITGAAVGGGVAGYGAVEVATLVGSGAAASPSVTAITTTLATEWQNARYAFYIATTWFATHPDEGNELAIWLGSIGINIVDAGGLKEFFGQIQDFESFVNIFGQMAEPVVNHEHAMNARRAAEGDPMGAEPTTMSTGPSTRPAADDPTAEPTSAARAPGAGDATPTVSPANTRILTRVRAFIDRMKGVASRARAAGAGTSDSAPPEPEASPNGAQEQEPTAKPEPSGTTANTTSETTAAASQKGRLPTSAENARALKAAGETWSNKEIRDYYNAENKLVSALDQEWIRQGKSVAERARLAFEHRHGMRMTAREMMSDPGQQLELLVRDAQKYGDGEGPTFEQLVEQQRAAGKEGDAAYEAIIAGAERTDAATNKRVQTGADKAPVIDLPAGATVHGDSLTVVGTNGRSYQFRIKRGGNGQVETIRNPDGTFDLKVDENAPPDVTLRQIARSVREFADTPRQGSDDLDHLYADAAVAQRELGDLTRSVASDLGGRALVPENLKGRPRAQEKIAADYQGENARITDLARSSIEFDTPQQIDQAMKEIGARAEIVRVKDRFKKPLDGYRDVMMNVRMPNGHIVEVQLHLKAILDVKNGPGHPLYEEIREIDARAKIENRQLTEHEKERRQELVAKMKALYDQAYEKSEHQGEAHGQ